MSAHLSPRSDPTGDPLTSARGVHVTAQPRQLMPMKRTYAEAPGSGASEQSAALTLKGSLALMFLDCFLYRMEGNYSPYLSLAGSILFHCHLWFLFSFSSFSFSFSTAESVPPSLPFTHMITRCNWPDGNNWILQPEKKKRKEKKSSLLWVG